MQVCRCVDRQPLPPPPPTDSAPSTPLPPTPDDVLMLKEKEAAILAAGVKEDHAPAPFVPDPASRLMRRRAFWNMRCWCIFSYIPDELLVSDVFTYLEPKDLVKVSRVCKRWFSLSKDKSLWRHVDLALISPSISISSWTALFSRVGTNVESIKCCEFALPSAYLDAVPSFVPNLRRLHVCCSSSVSDETLFQISGNLFNLESLVLSGCPRITDSGVKLMLEKCSMLKKISLQQCRLLSGSSFEVLDGKRVEEINLSACSEFEFGKFLTSGPSLGLLRTLNLHGTILDDHALHVLTDYAPNLEILALSSSNPFVDGPLTDFGIKCLSKLKVLKDLNLAGSGKVSDFGILELAQNCLALQRLNLAQCYRITDDAIRALSTHLKFLTHLNLYGCKALTDVSVEYLSCFSTRLQYLDLQGVRKITSSSVEHMMRFTADLLILNLANIRGLTAADVDRIRTVRKFQIIHY